MALVGPMTGGGDGATTASNTSTLTLPAGCQVGHVAVFTTAASTGSQTVSSLSTASPVLLSGPDTNSGNTHRSYAYGKVLDSADITAGTISITWSSGIRIISEGEVHSGVDTASPFGTAGNTIQGSGGTITMPTVNTTRPNSPVVALTTARVTSGTASASTYPAEFTRDGFVATAFTSGNNFGGSAAHLTTPGAAGSYGGGTIALSNSPVSASAYAIPLNPAATTQTLSGTTALSQSSTLSTGAADTTLAASALSAPVTLSTGASVTERAASTLNSTVTLVTGASVAGLTTTQLNSTVTLNTDASVTRMAVAAMSQGITLGIAALDTVGASQAMSQDITLATAAALARLADAALSQDSELMVTSGSFATLSAITELSAPVLLSTDGMTSSRGGQVFTADATLDTGALLERLAAVDLTVLSTLATDGAIEQLAAMAMNADTTLTISLLQPRQIRVTWTLEGRRITWTLRGNRMEWSFHE